MKSLILTLSFLFFSILSYSIEYPRFETDSLNRILVVITLEQAQSLDNSVDLINLLEKLDLQISNQDSLFLKIIDEQEFVIKTQEVQIQKLKEYSDNKDKIILNLKDVISVKDALINNHVDETQILKEEVELSQEEIKKLKRRMLFGGALSSSAILGLLLIILL